MQFLCFVKVMCRGGRNLSYFHSSAGPAAPHAVESDLLQCILDGTRVRGVRVGLSKMQLPRRAMPGTCKMWSDMLDSLDRGTIRLSSPFRIDQVDLHSVGPFQAKSQG